MTREEKRQAELRRINDWLLAHPQDADLIGVLLACAVVFLFLLAR